MIVGTGNVGASIAFSLLNQRTPVNEIILTDINLDDAEGEAMDLTDALSVSPSYMKVRSGSYDDARGCDIIVITAGAKQKPGQTRMDILKDNAKILKPMIESIMKSGFDGIFLVVSNPVDVLTYLVWKYSGLPSNRVISSGTVLDSARLRKRISELLNINPKSVHAYIIGEHGDTEFTFWSNANIGGERIATMISEPTRLKIEEEVRTGGYEIINRKGSTYYGIALCVSQIINTILNDERRILSVSTYDDNNNVFYGYPAVIGGKGVYRRLDLKLNEEEGIKLQKSINVLKEAIKSVS